MFPLKYLIGFGTNCIIVRNAEILKIKPKKFLNNKFFVKDLMKNILEYSENILTFWKWNLQN